MRNLLDDEALQGPNSVRITYRPERIGFPMLTDSTTSFLDAVRFECAVWGGATTALVPVMGDGTIRPAYADTLAGSTIDSVTGLETWGMFNLQRAKVRWPVTARTFGRQLAVALLKYREQGEYLPLQVVELEDGDPWKGVYAACLGLLPNHPDPSLLKDGALLPSLTFGDFLRVEQVAATGSLDDLLERLSNSRVMTPRRMSGMRLAYGSSGSTGIRTGDRVLPDPDFPRYDAGPNVLVVCSDVEDHALLWNLRGAWGDSRAVPIGVPTSALTPDSVRKLLAHETLSRNGIAHRQLYVTSVSHSAEELSDMVGGASASQVGVVGYEHMLTFGHAAGWHRDEVLSWKDSETKFVALPPDSHSDIFTDYGFSPYARMYVDVEVREHPFPCAGDLRVRTGNYEIYAGSFSRWGSARTRSETLRVAWPTRLLMARSVAASRELELRESAPGRIVRTALLGFSDLFEIGHLAHAPLLSLLDEMAASVGVNWAKRRLAQGADLGNTVAPAADLLTECSFDKFKRSLGNSPVAAKNWLYWAEHAGLIVKGFPLTCPACGAKQWTPVAAFSPPIVCRGCAGEMRTPFGDEPQVHFKYRMTERFRRVFEQDSIGHLLVMRYFDSLFGGSDGGRTIGMHPGMEVLRAGTTEPEGESDVLMLMRDGSFIPIEVKRSSSGFTIGEVEKLDHLANVLRAPWSAVATCQYGRDVDPCFTTVERRDDSADRTRLILSYDALLDPHPTWILGADPFEWAPLTDEEIEHREAEFVDRLKAANPGGTHDWMAEEMLHKPGLDTGVLEAREGD